jgi:Family of unknown function (DUF6789)
MNNVGRGIVAGLVATAVLSVIMILKGMMGLMPQLNVIAMLGSMMDTSSAIAWAIHFMIGAIAWGAGFAILFNLLPGKSSTGKGISLGIAAWLMMMVLVMPMAGAGMFGMNMGMMAPVMTLVLHLIFGAVLGAAFGKLGSAGKTATPDNTTSA